MVKYMKTKSTFWIWESSVHQKHMYKWFSLEKKGRSMNVAYF